MRDSNMIMWCLSMPYVFARTAISNVGWSVDWERPRLLNQNFSWCMHWFSRLDYCNSVLTNLPWSLGQGQLQSVLNSAARLIFGLKVIDQITPALMDLQWSPEPQSIIYKLCMIMFKCLRGSAPAYLTDRVGKFFPTIEISVFFHGNNRKGKNPLGKKWKKLVKRWKLMLFEIIMFFNVFSSLFHRPQDSYLFYI